METDAIKRLQAMMDELSEIRPVTMANIHESIRLENELVDLEVKECEKHNRQRAYRSESYSIFWDGRTDKVQLLIDPITDRTAHVMFAVFPKLDPKSESLCIIRVDGVLASRTTRLTFEVCERYPTGIVGILGLGIFEVLDSEWMKCYSGQSDSTIIVGIQHFCLVFADLLVEFLASTLILVDESTELSKLEKELEGIQRLMERNLD